MKRLLVVFAVALLFGATACKKTCTCITKQDGVETIRVEMEMRGMCPDLNTKTYYEGVLIEETTCN